MNKQVNTIEPVTKISIPATLMAIKVGETVVIPSKIIKAGSLRAAASRLEQADKAQFSVTEQGFIDGVQVTRLK